MALAGTAWLGWQVQPFLAVAGLLGRLETRTLQPRDLDPAALTPALIAGIETVERAEAEQQRQAARHLDALRGLAAGVHASLGVPALLAESQAPEAAAAVKRTQRALLQPAKAPSDPNRRAETTASTLATPQGVTALVHAAMARAPQDWPTGAYDRLAFVQPRLSRPQPDRLELTLRPSGIAPFWRSRVTVLEFRRDELLHWRLSGVRLPPATVHARAVLDAAAPPGQHNAAK